MNSIKPTTSAKPLVERATLVAVAIMAAGAAVLCVRDARGAYLRELGAASVDRAETMQRGAARDRMLDLAQSRLHDAIAVYARDPALYRAMARTRYLQATGAEITDVSPPLLEAAISAAREAEALDPLDHEAPARIAQAMSALPGADAREAAAALGRSFLRRGLDPSAGAWRIRAAAPLWGAMSADTRQAVLAEACVIARSGPSGQNDVLQAMAREPQLAATFAEITPRAGCAPGALTQNPDN